MVTLSDGSAVGGADILVAEPHSVATPFVKDDQQLPIAALQSGDGILAFEDVIQESAGNPDLGAYLSFESVGADTVISVNADVGDPSAPVFLATVNNVTGMTLQQLLAEGSVAG
jgi:hypothetical protein